MKRKKYVKNVITVNDVLTRKEKRKDKENENESAEMGNSRSKPEMPIAMNY